MGWTSYHATHYKNGKVDRKAECDAMFNSDAVSWNEDHKVIGRYEVLKSSMIGSTYYAAVKKTIFATEEKPENINVFAMVCLTNTDAEDHFNFAYKDMDESCGPYKYDCPKGILDLLTPTESEFANEWRNRCRENLEKKKDKNSLSKLPIGSEIKFTLHDGRECIAFKHPPAYQFKRPFWKIKNDYGYIKTKNIPENYEIIKRGDC